MYIVSYKYAKFKENPCVGIDVSTPLKGKMPVKMYKKNSRKKNAEKKICVPTLPKMFRPVTQNTHIFLFGLTAFPGLSH